mgnify:CR=1 FL=1
MNNPHISKGWIAAIIIAAVVIIEHRLEDVLWRNVDRIVLMKDGEIVANLPTKELLCSNLLMEHGIREPLYLTALRYAGILITPEMEPQHVNSLRLTDEQKRQVKDWFEKERETHPESEGEEPSIVGKNGAGKSTLAKLICGFEKPLGGEIRLQGRDLAKDTIKERAAHIGYVMQNPNQMISKPMIWE